MRRTTAVSNPCCSCKPPDRVSSSTSFSTSALLAFWQCYGTDLFFEIFKPLLFLQTSRQGVIIHIIIPIYTNCFWQCYFDIFCTFLCHSDFKPLLFCKFKTKCHYSYYHPHQSIMTTIEITIWRRITLKNFPPLLLIFYCFLHRHWEN